LQGTNEWRGIISAWVSPDLLPAPEEIIPKTYTSKASKECFFGIARTVLCTCWVAIRCPDSGPSVSQHGGAYRAALPIPKRETVGLSKKEYLHEKEKEKKEKGKVNTDDIRVLLLTNPDDREHGPGLQQNRDHACRSLTYRVFLI
jgi:hypothetical protein